MSDVAIADTYSDAVGRTIDDKFRAFSFGTNTRGIVNHTNDPFRRNNTIFMPNNPDLQYPGFFVPPCTFDTSCCGAPPSTAITVSGRLKNCYDPSFDESLARWTYNTRLPRYAKKYTTNKVGFDATEN